jgi:hypothetical protein
MCFYENYMLLYLLFKDISQSYAYAYASNQTVYAFFLPADINMSTIKWHIPRKCIGDVSCINMFSSTSHDN